MLIDFKRGQGSIVLRVKIRNSSVSTGAGLTGLTSASAGLKISTIADNESTATTYTVAGSTIETITTLGTFAAPTATKCRFKEVDATNHPGIVEIQIADARYAASNAKSLLVSISGATNAAECDVLIPLRDVDPYDAVRLGLTALPNAPAEAAGGLYTRGTGAGQIKQTNNGEIDANATHINNVATTSVTTVNAKIGTTSDIGFSANTFVKTDLRSVKDALIATGGDIVSMLSDANAGLVTVRNTLGTASDLGGGDTLAANNADTFARIGAPAGASIAADIAAKPTAAQNATAVLAAGDIDGFTLEQFGKLCLAALTGKLSGAASTSVVIRAADDSKARITATVDADGNRTALTLDAAG